MTEERRASSDGRADDVVLDGTRRRGVEGSRGLAIVDMVAVGVMWSCVVCTEVEAIKDAGLCALGVRGYHLRGWLLVGGRQREGLEQVVNTGEAQRRRHTDAK